MFNIENLKNVLYKKELPKEVESNPYSKIYERLDVVGVHEALNKLFDLDRFLTKHGGAEKLDIILSDLEVSAAWDKRKAGISNTEVILETESEELKAYFEENLLKHEDQLKKDFLMAVGNGYNVEQIIYDEDRSGAIVGFQREDFWRFIPHKDLVHVSLYNSTNHLLRRGQDEILPYGKWVLTTNDATPSNPAGDSLFKKIYVYWAWKCLGFEAWAKFVQKYASGFMVGKTSPESVKDMQRAMEKAVQGAVFAATVEDDLQLLFPSSNGETFKKFDDQIINAIYRAILGETQSSIMEARGGSASAEVHNGVRIEKIRSDAKLIQKAFNDTIEQIALVNGFDLEKNPVKAKIVLEQGLETDRAERDSKLTSQGVVLTKEYYMRHYGLKEDEIDDIDAFEGASFSQEPLTFAPNSSRPKKKNGLDAVEKTIELLLDEGTTPFSNDDIIAAMRSSENIKDLRKNLAALYAQDDISFSEDVAKALYRVAILGAEDVHENS